MDNYIQKGDKLDYTNAGAAIESGDVVVIGDRIGVAEGDIAATTGEGVVLMEGVVELAKVSGTAFVIGDKLYWDESEEKLTKTAAGNVPAGICFAAAASDAVLAWVKLGNLSDFTAAANVATAAFNAVVTGGTPDCSAAAIDTVIGTIQTKVNAILTALKNAGLMTPDA